MPSLKIGNAHTKYVDYPNYGRIYRYKVKKGSANHRIFFRISDDGKEINVITILHMDVAYDYQD